MMVGSILPLLLSMMSPVLNIIYLKNVLVAALAQ